MRTTLLVALCFVLASVGSSRAQYSLQDAYPNLPSFSRAIEMQHVPDGSKRFIVVEQRGHVWIVENNATVSARRMFLDLSAVVSQKDNEVGLLGAAFDPNYAQNHYIYFSYDTGNLPQYYSLVVRYTVSTSNPDSIIPSSKLTILTFAQPLNFPNHKGGCLRFGPDGYLYASFGDGGSGGDPYKNGQNTSVFMGKILRLDVAHPGGGNNYGIPADNPFAGDNTGKKKEIFAYGLRNVWRFGFDRATGWLWAADVGQDLWEEVDIIRNGGNYGWNTMEGRHCYPPSNTGCDRTGLTSPIYEYGHSAGNVSITGGYVYRGKMIPSLLGKYIFADAGSGRVWALSYDGIDATNATLVDKSSPSISIPAFALDTDDEILPIVWSSGGSVARINRLIGPGAGVQSPELAHPTLSVNVVPNPFTNQTRVLVTSPRQVVSITLTDVLGHVTKLDPKSDLTFRSNDLGLQAGTYLLTVSDGEQSVSTKVVCLR